jgi:hypothetical protein
MISSNPIFPQVTPDTPTVRVHHVLVVMLTVPAGSTFRDIIGDRRPVVVRERTFQHAFTARLNVLCE